MNKQLSICSMILSLFVGITLMAFNLQQKDNKGKNEHPQKQSQSKGNQKANDNKGKPDKTPANQAQGNQDKGNGNANNDKGNDKADNGKGNNGKGNDLTDLKDNRGNNGNGNKARIKLPGDNNWYNWSNENFKDRKQLRNKGKVTICHKFSSNEEPVSITVSENAMKAHLGHGDVVGECPAVTNSIFSDIFKRRRTAYYNDLYYGQDQYNYSNSVLDYALIRLTNSRLQLDQMRANNAAQADIDRRQASVVQLEQNVSLLETVLGVAGQLLVNRLQ